MSKEAMTLALDLATMHHTDEGFDELRSKVRVAAKEALAKQEQPTVRTGNCLRVGVCASEGHKIQAKQEQGEPDDEVLGFNGWGFPIERPTKREQCGTCKGKFCIGEGSKDDPIRSCPSCNPKTLAKQEQGEPDKYVMDIECTKCGAKQSGILTVNTTPQPAQKTWVGLTTEDMATCIEQPAWDLILLKAEQILKEKNT